MGELAGLAVARVFEEPGVSGGTALADRPGGRELLAVLRPGDTVIVGKLDRAFRNAADALATAEAWKRRGVDLIVADMGTCRGRSKSRPLRRRRLLAPSAYDAKA